MAAKYERVQIIGRGSFGLAWLARSLTSQRPYVVKEVRLAGMTEKERNQAMNEVDILAGLKHANVVRYREAFMEQAILHIAMEYADGGDLNEIIQSSRRDGQHIPGNSIMDWFVQICFALCYIHTKKILHRDLKPQNIFMTNQGIVKVGDFGIARMLRDTGDHAHTAIGTPYYMSPEICRRKPYNFKSDMWAAGCVLYEMAALVHPFEANDISSLVTKIMRGHYKAIPRYGPLLEDLVSVLLRVEPERRPSADQILAIPGIQNYVLAFTDRRKNQCSSPGVIREQECSRNSSRKEDKLFRIEQSSVATARRHSVASFASKRKCCVLSTSKHRHQSVGYCMKDCEPSPSGTHRKVPRGTTEMAGNIYAGGQLETHSLNTNWQHRVISTNITPGKVKPPTKNQDCTRQSTGHTAWKENILLKDDVNGTVTAISTSASSTRAFTRASSNSFREDFVNGKMEKPSQEANLEDDRQLKMPIAKLKYFECNGDNSLTRSLKESTFVLEKPSMICLGNKESNKRSPSVNTEGYQHLEKCDENKSNTLNYSDLEGIPTLGSTYLTKDSHSHWVDSGLQCTVIDRKETKSKCETCEGKSPCIRGKGNSNLRKCPTNAHHNKGGSADLNECLFRNRISTRDTERDVRGKMETLRVFLEENIGIELSLTCLNLVRSVSGGKLHRLMSDKIVLTTMEEYLGKDKMSFVPAVLHLHNLEQSCDLVSE